MLSLNKKQTEMLNNRGIDIRIPKREIDWTWQTAMLLIEYQLYDDFYLG